MSLYLIEVESLGDLKSRKNIVNFIVLVEITFDNLQSLELQLINKYERNSQRRASRWLYWNWHYIHVFHSQE